MPRVPSAHVRALLGLWSQLPVLGFWAIDFARACTPDWLGLAPACRYNSLKPGIYSLLSPTSKGLLSQSLATLLKVLVLFCLLLTTRLWTLIRVFLSKCPILLLDTTRRTGKGSSRVAMVSVALQLVCSVYVRGWNTCASWWLVVVALFDNIDIR